MSTNVTEVQIGNGILLLSYGTPVALHVTGEGYFKTDRFWSRTTSKHISQFGAKEGKVVSQEYLNGLLKGVRA